MRERVVVYVERLMLETHHPPAERWDWRV